MTISIPDLAVSFASHLPDDVTVVSVTRDSPHIVFRVVKGDGEIRYLESESMIERAKYDVGMAVAERALVAFAEYERGRERSGGETMTEPRAYVQIGEKRFPLTLDRAYSHITKKNDGVAIRFRANLSDIESGGKYAYSFAEINVCHEHGCPATRLGKKFGPCNCGGDGLWRELLVLVGESYEGTSAPTDGRGDQGHVDAPSPGPQST